MTDVNQNCEFKDKPGLQCEFQDTEGDTEIILSQRRRGGREKEEEEEETEKYILGAFSLAPTVMF